MIPTDPSVGVLNGIGLVCERAGADARDIAHVLHGTTVATNAILTGIGGDKHPAQRNHEHDAQQGDDRGGNGGRYRHTDLEAQIDVCRAHDDGQGQPDGDRVDRQFLPHGLLLSLFRAASKESPARSAGCLRPARNPPQSP